MKRNSVLMALVVGLAMIFAGCKDDEVPAIEYGTQGFIKGNLQATTSEGALNESFNYTGFPLDEESESFYYMTPDELQLNDSLYTFSIQRFNVNKGGSIFLRFEVDELTEKPSSVEYEYIFRKETNNKLYFFAMGNTNDGLNSADISNFTFDPKTGRLKGSYTFRGSSNSSEKNATVKGEFDLIVKKVVQ